MSDDEGDDKKGLVHLTTRDYGRLVTYMENRDNFVAICGASKKTAVAGKPLISKTAAFAKMAEYLQKHSTTPNLPILTGRNMQQRWKTFYTKFVKTLKLSQSQTGAGLTKAEIAQGLSLPAKWEKMCPHFSRMAALFKGRSNISPAATLELGAFTRYKQPGTTQESDSLSIDPNQVSSESEGEDNEFVVLGTLGPDHEGSKEKRVNFPLSDLLSGMGNVELSADESRCDMSETQDAPNVYEKIDTFIASIEGSEDWVYGDEQARDVEDGNNTGICESEANPCGHEERPKQPLKRQTPAGSKNVPGNRAKKAKIAAKGAGSKHPEKGTRRKQVKSGDDESSDPEQKEKAKKTKKGSVQETRLSVAQSYNRNMGIKLTHMQEKLEVAKEKIAAKQMEAERQRDFDAAQREIDRKERREEKKRELLLELARKNTPRDDVDHYMKYF